MKRRSLPGCYYLSGCPVGGRLALWLGAAVLLPTLWLILWLAALTAPSGAAGRPPPTITVDTLEDELNEDGDCSLREAVAAANANLAVDACPAGDPVLTDTITFAAAGTISLTARLVITAGGSLAIDGGGVITVSGDYQDLVFQVDAGATAAFQNIIIADGYRPGSTGGGINNRGGTVRVSNTTIVNNDTFLPFIECGGRGGGIYNGDNGIMLVVDSAISENISCEGSAIYNAQSVITISRSYVGGHAGRAVENGSNARLAVADSVLMDNGAAIFNDQIVSVTNSVFNRNGEGLRNRGAAVVMASTFMTGGRGIWNEGSGVLTLVGSTLQGNSPYSGGGAVVNQGRARITDTLFVANSAGSGGGLYNFQGTVTLDGCTFLGNSAGMGGGITNDTASGGVGWMQIANSTFSGNMAADLGGAILNVAAITLTNVTFNGNQADSGGGGLYNVGEALVGSTTFNGDSAPFGDELYAATPLWLVNSIVAGGAANNCYDQIVSLGHNIADDLTCNLNGPGDLNGVNPLLGPLQANGGFTLTQLPYLGSPAVDAGDDASCPTRDQRGFARPVDGDRDGQAVCDIGAVERWPGTSFMPVAARD